MFANEMPTLYQVDEAVIQQAIDILASRLRAPGAALASPKDVKAYLTLQTAELEHEVFGCLFVDVKNRLIECKTLFRGTLQQTSVYPREVVREALGCNASGAILFHNHPSGNPEPSEADRLLTSHLKQALALIDVRALDHVIVAGLQTYSFAERGEL